MPEAKLLMELSSPMVDHQRSRPEKSIWQKLLALHAENQWVIGTVTGDLQPIVVAAKLKNVPEKGIFSSNPTSLLGIYRIDEFFYAK
jgi:peptide/nickel transport system substrate-binding protein